MDPAAARDALDDPFDAPGLPRCRFRRRHDEERFRCEAGEAVVTAGDCRACSIPAAVAHPDACLHLVPLRHQGEPQYACRWFFSFAKEPTVDDWRELCFCPYWFPRGGDSNEALIAGHMADTRAHYLRVLRGEEPCGNPREPLSREYRASEPTPSAFDRWRRWLLERLSSRHD